MSRTAVIEARRLPEARILRLTWDDGAVAELPYDLLQGYCPCAGCRGHAGGEIEYLPPKQPITAVSLAPVGNYGLATVFTGGCNSGIFSFDWLREIATKENKLVLPS
jgi:DUF971 family protein